MTGEELWRQRTRDPYLLSKQVYLEVSLIEPSGAAAARLLSCLSGIMVRLSFRGLPAFSTSLGKQRDYAEAVCDSKCVK